MTKEEILALQPGREMDEIVLKEIMGGDPSSGNIPAYSTDIAAACDILQKFEWVNLLRGQVGLWTCTLRKYRGTDFQEVQSLSRQAPEAICKVALMAATTGVFQ